jgi:uncharacterized membrane protein YhaH (DUF805 family)
MADDIKRYWFPAKRYGWGWGLPATWQGWVVFAIWFAVVLPIAPWLATRSLAAFFIFVAIMSAVLIAICYAKGEPPRWRWGEK